MNISQAFFSGVVGTAVAIVVVGAGRAAGIDVGLEDALGGAWPLGLGLLLVTGGLVALAYGLGFERLAGRLDVRWLAVGFGAVHAAVALHLFAMVGAVTSEASAGGPTFQLPALAVLIAAHLAFALVTGILYRVVLAADRDEQQPDVPPRAGTREGPARAPISPRRLDPAA